MRQIIVALPPALSQAIRVGDVAAIQREVMPAVQADPTLAEWLSQLDVGDWLTSYLQRIRTELDARSGISEFIPPPVFHSPISDEDIIV